jgi:L-2-hydroxycarboxylate dehydrogenase (NAD+)
MATSAIALFGVLTAKSKGESLPNNVAYDKDGNWTTDATEVLENGGSIATFGGHKGMGLSLCVELLTSALSGAAVVGQVESKKIAKSWGHTFIAIRPELLVDDFPTRAKSIVDTVKKSKEDSGDDVNENRMVVFQFQKRFGNQLQILQ